MSRFGAPSPKLIIEKIANNDAGTTSVDLSANALFTMKTFEYCGLLAEALKKNTVVTEITLGKLGITDPDVELIAGALAVNQTITTVNLDGNKLGSDGAVHIANGLKTNSSVTHIVLLNNGAFGETCLEVRTVSPSASVVCRVSSSVGIDNCRTVYDRAVV
jgi:Ran GTPase-activating protein (RanGAP) involved in mRNA processing and transport